LFKCVKTNVLNQDEMSVTKILMVDNVKGDREVEKAKQLFQLTGF